MNVNPLRIKFCGLIILLAMMACALPSQAISPAPVVNQSSIETSIVGTAQVAKSQTEQASLIIPTLAIAPAETNTPTLAIAPAETNTPMPVFSSYGTALTKQEDGAAVFVDQRAKMKIIFPSNWLAMRVGEPEYYQAWENEGAQNPDLLDAVTAIQNLDLNRFRVTAYDMHPEHTLHGNLPKINIVFLQGDTRSLKEVDVDERNRESVLKDYKVLPSEFKKTSTGVDILTIQYQWTSSSQTSSYASYYKGVMFKVPDGTVAVDLFIPFDLKESLEQELNQIIESLTLFY